jgi:uncharacterized protein YnzC (UPF0291/DUF896 family)
METRYIDFCKLVDEKIILDDEIENEPLDWTMDYRDRISFSVYIDRINPHSGISLHPGIKVLELDKEDIEWLRSKYLKKLNKEMEDKISQIKKEYGGI